MSRVAVLVGRIDGAADGALAWLAGRTSLHLYADARLPSVERAAARWQAELTVSDQRALRDGAGTLRLADASMAAELARRHRSDPWEAIVDMTDSVHDPTWDEPVLEDVPFGRVLGTSLGILATTLDDPRRFAEDGANLVALVGDCALADFLIDPFDLAAPLGGRLPPTVSPAVGLQGPPGATAIDVRGLDAGAACERVLDEIEQADGSVFVVGLDPRTGEALERKLQPAARERVVFIRASDPVAEELATGPPSTADRAAASSDLPWPPSTSPAPSPRMLATSDPETVAHHLGGLDPADPTPSVLGPDPSVACPTRRTTGADLAFACRRWEPMGEADPYKLRDDWVMVGAGARQEAIQAARHSTDFRQFIWRLTEPGLVSSATIGLVPAPPTTTFLPLRTRRHIHDTPVRLSPPRLPMPNLALEPPPPVPAQPATVKQWAGNSPWTTRLRLALPWRWGLLPKAMKGRW